MSKELLGQTCAFLAAATWAVALVLFKRTGEHIPPLALNLFKNIVGLVLLGATLVFMPHDVQALHDYPPEDIIVLALSGILGIALADTVFFYGLNLIGVGLISIVDCLYTPFIIIFSYLILSEELSLSDYIGTGLILAGVFISSRHGPPVGRTRGQLIVGMIMGASAMAFMTFGIVIAKPVLVLYDFPLILATTLRMLAGTVALALLAVASPDRRVHWSAFTVRSTWKFSIPASVLGSYGALVLWMAGFKYAEKAGIAGILNQTSVIFAIILAALLLKESFTQRKAAAVVLAMGGVVLVMLGPD
jgi:drug/metabolite transporter (DMT)-like permease